MRRRILTAIVGSVLVAVVILSVPLALINGEREREKAIRELERTALRTQAMLEPADLTLSDAVDIPATEGNINIGVYDTAGRRVAGRGPARIERLVAKGDSGTHSGVIGGARVLGLPVISDEERTATIRVAEPASEAQRTIDHDLLVLIGIDAAAVAVAAAIGAWLAARLTRPLQRIRDDAVRLGDGDFTITPRPSGIPELDDTAVALADTAARLDATLARERAFSADASHQLRTPLASIRVNAEAELVAPRDDPTLLIGDILMDVDRLDATIDTLLAVARDRSRPATPVALAELTEEVRCRWQRRLQEAHRDLRVEVDSPSTFPMNRAVVEQVLDILIANAVEHGTGRITLRVSEDASEHLNLTVSDDGTLNRPLESLFTRGDSHAGGNGLGLAIAQSLTEADGGRLLLVSEEPTSFRMILPGQHASGTATSSASE